jgi:Tfp pilus assembly protein PilF
MEEAMSNSRIFSKLILVTLISVLAACSAPSTESDTMAEQNLPVTDHYKRGKYYVEKGYNGLAINQFKLALLENPDSIEILNAVAIIYQRLNRPDMAEQAFRKAIILDTNSALTMNNFGYFHLSQGRPRQAISYFETARQVKEYEDVATSNLELANQTIQEEAEVSNASLAIVEEIVEPSNVIESVSLERMSNSVYVLNTKRNPNYDHAIVQLKLNPLFIVRNSTKN